MKPFVGVLIVSVLAYKPVFECVAADGARYLSNLENRWPGQAPGEIGDIHSVTAYGRTTVAFTTGNQETTLRAVSFEFLIEPSSIGSWDSVDVHLRSSGTPTITAQLGAPQLSQMMTQWPKESFPNIYKRFVEFQPAGATYLPPLSDFEVVVSRRPGSPLDSGLLFTRSEAYKSLDGWKMGPTTSANPFAVGEFLKFAVYATAVPEPSAFALVGLAALWPSLRRLAANVAHGRDSNDDVPRLIPWVAV